MDFIEESKYKNNYGIYGIVNILNGNIYVGQTSESFQRRYWHYRWKLNDGSHDNAHLQKAWNKYGEENFQFIILEIVNDKNLLDDLEIKYISYYKKENKSYNMLIGGGGRRGFKMSEHAKKIVGQKNREHMLGTKHSEKTKKKMSEKRTGMVIKKKTDVLDEDIVRKIKELLISGKSASQVAKELSVNYKNINNLIANNTWKSVIVNGWDEFRANRKTYKRLTRKDHVKIYNLYHNKEYTDYQLANMYNRSIDRIRQIIKDDNNNKSYDNPVPSLNEN